MNAELGLAATRCCFTLEETYMPDNHLLRLRVAASGQDRAVDFPLPSGWRAKVYPPIDAPALSARQVSRAFSSPTGSMPIAEAARGARSAVILVDDFRRPTPIGMLCTHVLTELTAAGVTLDRIAIITGGGAHRAQRRKEAKRLGSVLTGVGKWLIHDAFDPKVQYVGLTSAGTPVLVNEIAAQADFSISISTVYPHPFTAWGGGAKLVLPGISHLSSIHYHHGRLKGSVRAASPSHCPARRDLEEAAALFGLNISICAVMNSSKELCGVFVGAPSKAHRRAISAARKIYRTDLDGVTPDLVIANAYPLDGDPTQLSKSAWPASYFGVPTIQIFDFADPSPYHGLYHGLPHEFRAQQKQRNLVQDPAGLMTAKQILYSPQYGKGFVPVTDSYYYENNWPRLMQGLEKRFPHASVAVLPAAALQLPSTD